MSKAIKLNKAQQAHVNAVATLASAFATRIGQANNANLIKNLSVESRLFANDAIVAYMLESGIDVDALASMIAQHDKGAKSGFLAVYAMQKVRKILYACATGLKSTLDGYTRAIVQNLFEHEKLSNKGALMSLCKSVSFGEFETVEAVTRAYNCAPSTASTQASSTREALRALHIATCSKGAQREVFTLNAENVLTVKLSSMFVSA